MSARDDEIRRVVAELDIHIAEVEASVAVLKALLARRSPGRGRPQLTQSFARSLGADCVNGPSVSLLYSRRRARPPTTRPPPSGRALPCSVGSERRSQLGRTASLSNSKLPARPRSSERLTPVDRTSTVSLVSTKARWANCMFICIAALGANARICRDEVRRDHLEGRRAGGVLARLCGPFGARTVVRAWLCGAASPAMGGPGCGI